MSYCETPKFRITLVYDQSTAFRAGIYSSPNICVDYTLLNDTIATEEHRNYMDVIYNTWLLHIHFVLADQVY